MRETPLHWWEICDAFVFIKLSEMCWAAVVLLSNKGEEEETDIVLCFAESFFGENTNACWK